MSIMRCEQHQRNWDSDIYTECPDCEDLAANTPIAAHTPGPWECVHASGAGFQIFANPGEHSWPEWKTTGKGPSRLWDLREHPNRFGIGDARFTGWPNEKWDAMQGANGRLMAASPDLLAALLELVDRPLRYNGNNIEIECADHADAMKRVQAARAAITKATTP